MNGWRIGALAFALVATAGTAGAQGTPREEHGKGHRFGHFYQELGLTEAQRTQIRAIHERYQPQMQQLHATARQQKEAARAAMQRGDTAAARTAREQARAAMEQTRAQREQLHNAMQAEVRAILTPEQQTRFDALRAAQRERMQERRGPRGGGARGFRGPRGQRGARAVS
jgi:protein CpxP